MGRRSRSRSPSSRRRQSPSRRHRDRDHDRKKDKDRTTAADARRLMRESLQAASSSGISEAEGSAARSRAIEMIEDSGFQQSSFKSTAGGAGGRVYQHKDKKKKDEAASHDRAIFGPSMPERPRSDKDSEANIPMPTMVAAPKADVQMFHKNFLADPETRKQQWLTQWRDYRRTLSSI